MGGAEDPTHCWYISKDELQFLGKHIARPRRESRSGSKRGLFGMPNFLLKHRGLWAIFGAHMAFNYGAYFITNWSPIYYAEVFELKPDEAKWYLAAPHVTNLCCKSLNPMLVALAERQGISLLRSRRLFTVAGFLLAGLVLLPMYQLRFCGPLFTMIFFSAANACFGLAL